MVYFWPMQTNIVICFQMEAREKRGNKKYILNRSELIMVYIYFFSAHVNQNAKAIQIAAEKIAVHQHTIYNTAQGTESECEFPKVKNKISKAECRTRKMLNFITYYKQSIWLVTRLKLKCLHRRQTIHIFHFLSFFPFCSFRVLVLTFLFFHTILWLQFNFAFLAHTALIVIWSNRLYAT